MKRRKFIKTAAVGLVASNVMIAADELKRNTGNPIVLSTWSHGLPANDAAMKALKRGGSALDAVEAGDKDLATENFDFAKKFIDKNVKWNQMHPNTAARKKSHLAQAVNSI